MSDQPLLTPIKVEETYLDVLASMNDDGQALINEVNSLRALHPEMWKVIANDHHDNFGIQTDGSGNVTAIDFGSKTDGKFNGHIEIHPNGKTVAQKF
jgi:hypothetical protein